jgi:hypothetical protein
MYNTNSQFIQRLTRNAAERSRKNEPREDATWLA